MLELATIPFARSRATDWGRISLATLRVSERALKGAALLKAGRYTHIAPALEANANLYVPGANTWASNRGTQWLWQGPKEWLLLSDTEAGTVLAEHTLRALAQITATALDVTDRVLQLDISGSTAPHLFAKGTSLDAQLLPPGACCRTRFANLQATVVRFTSGQDFSLITDRATSVYLHAWLTRAARDLAPAPAR